MYMYYCWMLAKPLIVLIIVSYFVSYWIAICHLLLYDYCYTCIHIKDYGYDGVELCLISFLLATVSNKVAYYLPFYLQYTLMDC